MARGARSIIDTAARDKRTTAGFRQFSRSFPPGPWQNSAPPGRRGRVELPATLVPLIMVMLQMVGPARPAGGPDRICESRSPGAVIRFTLRSLQRSGGIHPAPPPHRNLHTPITGATIDCICTTPWNLVLFCRAEN